MEKEIVNRLFELQDREYGEFQSRLIPNLDKNCVIGVRTPELRKLAKEFDKNFKKEEFLRTLPHKYFEENQLHAFIIELDKNFENCLNAVNNFLPYIDNWATCDQLSPKVFGKHKDRLLDNIKIWIASDSTYTIRFAVKMLMVHFLDKDYNTEYPEIVSCIHSDEYYVNMMIAWYFSTALAKQYDSILPYIINRKLNAWVHNKAIQKAVESRRISLEQKAELRKYRIVDKKGG